MAYKEWNSNRESFPFKEARVIDQYIEKSTGYKVIVLEEQPEIYLAQNYRLKQPGARVANSRKKSSY